MRIVDSLRTHTPRSVFLLTFPTASCSLLYHPLFLLPLFCSYIIRRPFLHFSESQITAPTCSHQRVPIWSACKTYSAVHLPKQQQLNLLGPSMWMHQNMLLSNPGRPTPVTSLPTNQEIPISTELTSSSLWPDFSSMEQGGCEMFLTHHPHRQAWAMTPQPPSQGFGGW